MLRKKNVACAVNVTTNPAVNVCYRRGIYRSSKKKKKTASSASKTVSKYRRSIPAFDVAAQSWTQGVVKIHV